MDKCKNCETCGGTGYIETVEQTFWNEEEGHVMAETSRPCKQCNAWD